MESRLRDTAERISGPSFGNGNRRISVEWAPGSDTMEWLNDHHVFYFWRIARKGGVSRAADQLRLTHSTRRC